MLDVKKLPWASNMFSWGVVAIVFGVGSWFWYMSQSILTLDELTVYKGKLVKIEQWQAKTKNGIDLFLSDDLGTKRLNSTYCEKFLGSINVGDDLTIYAEKVPSISRVVGRVWQIENSTEVICDYEFVVKRNERLNILNFYLACVVFSLGMIFSIIGYRKNKITVTH